MDLLREFIRYSFYVVERDDCTISKLLLLAVKWNASNSNQPTTDHNKSVIKVFNNKKNLLIGLSSLDNFFGFLLCVSSPFPIVKRSQI